MRVGMTATRPRKSAPPEVMRVTTRVEVLRVGRPGPDAGDEAAVALDVLGDVFGTNVNVV